MRPHGTPTKYICLSSTLYISLLVLGGRRYHVISLKFPSAISTVHHVLTQHLDSYSDHATLFPAQVWGGIRENFILASSCALYICVCVCVCACMYFWLISLYLWFALVFLFSRVYYGFTPLRHHTSRHYTSWHISNCRKIDRSCYLPHYAYCLPTTTFYCCFKYLHTTTTIIL
jgi:hypothetical protein